MTTIAMATADAPYDHCSGNFTKSSEQARTGTYSFKCAYQSLSIPHSIANPVYGRAAFYYSTNTNFFYIHPYTTNVIARIIVYPTYIQVKDAGDSTVLGTVSLPNLLNTWHVLEWKIYSHTSQGYVILKLNGQTIIEAYDVDTWTSAPDGAISHLFSSYVNTTVYFDDIVIDDANWPGLGGLIVRPASGNGNYTAWTGGYSDSYVSTDAETAGTKESFTKDALPATVSIVRRVGIVFNALTTEVGGSKVTPFIRSNSIDDDGVTGGFDKSEIIHFSFWDTDPGNGDAAWNRTTVDACEIGVKSA